jgi:hypothetical protein
MLMVQGLLLGIVETRPQGFEAAVPKAIEILHKVRLLE